MLKIGGMRKIAGVCAFTVCAPSFAIGFGTFDARTLSMGGAAVASGSADHAHFYNPALLSFHNEDEDESRNGRVIFPGAVALVSDAGEAAADIVSDDLDERITDTVNVFNACLANVGSGACQAGAGAEGRTVQSAASELLGSLNDFDDAVDSLENQTIEAEVYFGFSVSEPANREGGSFYFGVRGVALGRSNITADDRTLLNTYISAATTLANNGSIADLDPTIVDGNGLRDPRPSLTSTGEISSLLIKEWGLAFAKEFSLWGQPVSFGATPKILELEVYREDINFVDDIPSYSENNESHLTMNFDLGVAADVYKNVRVGLTVKDVLPNTFSAGSGLEVNIEPRARLGLAYINNFVTVGLDFDVIKNQALANEPESQEAALGLEFSPWNAIDLRFGYRQDIAGEREDILSAGIRYQIWRFVAEASVATGDDVTGGALQLGWAF